jgi:hypothetical protein
MIGGLVMLVVYLLILGLVVGLLLYIVDTAPFIVAPFKGWLHWAVVVIGCLIAIVMLLNFVGVDVGLKRLSHAPGADASRSL